MVASFISRMVILSVGVLYPAYASFKAVRRKSHRDYTKWMMYWIVFALFQAVETFTDTFLPWLPFYHELKILFVLWLVLPITEGSKQMYRLIVHPFLLRHEERIDRGIAQAGQTGFDTLRRVSQAGLNKAATTVVTSAIMGQNVLTETLLRAERRDTNGTDQPDFQGEVPTDSYRRPETNEERVSSSYLEPFVVIDEESEALRHPPVPGEGFLGQPLPRDSNLVVTHHQQSEDSFWPAESQQASSSNSSNNNSNPSLQSDGLEIEQAPFHDHQS